MNYSSKNGSRGKTRRPGDQETRRHGDQETRRPGDQETRRHGDTETRRGEHGSSVNSASVVVVLPLSWSPCLLVSLSPCLLVCSDRHRLRLPSRENLGKDLSEEGQRLFDLLRCDAQGWAEADGAFAAAQE